MSSRSRTAGHLANTEVPVSVWYSVCAAHTAPGHYMAAWAEAPLGFNTLIVHHKPNRWLVGMYYAPQLSHQIEFVDLEWFRNIPFSGMNGNWFASASLRHGMEWSFRVEIHLILQLGRFIQTWVDFCIYWNWSMSSEELNWNVTLRWVNWSIGVWEWFTPRASIPVPWCVTSMCIVLTF